MKALIKDILGEFLVTVQPEKAKSLAKNGMTINDGAAFDLRERLMRRFMLKKAEEDGDVQTLSRFQKNYWKNKGKEFFARTDDNFENIFLPDCSFVFDILEKELARDTSSYTTLVEIGTGNGSVLDYLSSKFNQIETFVGIDLSQEQTEINQRNFAGNARLKFVAADGFDWVAAHGKSNTIFVTSMGVLEYFTERRLQSFLKMIGGLGNIYFVAIEPNGTDHDFKQNANSQSYGQERSFSHNYQMLFENAGFEIWHSSTKHYDNHAYYFSFIGAKI